LTVHAIITTIQPPTEAVKDLHSRLGEEDILLIIGDAKGPTEYPLPSCPRAELVTLDQQKKLPFALARLLPENHYTRKNLGYLLAIQKGARSIYETDDDNAPTQSWRPRTMLTEACPVAVDTAWCNVYQLFTSETIGASKIWPRGLPLDQTVGAAYRLQAEGAIAPIQQGLANGSPDVDAVWRMVFGNEFNFLSAPSVVLPAKTWCPFNSQSTWWWEPAFPLLYLPSHCSFRMTDIWRSFVAQRCLWEFSGGVVFHAAEVYQKRNEHRLLKDFADEIPGYLHNGEIIEILSALDLEPGIPHIPQNMRACYKALAKRKIFPLVELILLDAWLSDLRPLSARYL
jgi:hypothetical protein